MKHPSHIHIAKWILLAIEVVLLASCRVDRYLAPDELVLYDNQYNACTLNGNDAPPEVIEVLKEQKNYTLQTPNSRILFRPLRATLWIYTLAAPNDHSWWGNYLHRQGQAPVVYDANAAMLTTLQLQGLLESKGCFHSMVTFDTLRIHKRNISIRYNITATPRRRISEVTYTAETPDLLPLLSQWKGESLLQENDYYDQSKLLAERERVVQRLNNNGYYTITPSLISYVVDTTFNDSLLSIELHIKNPISIGADQQPQSHALQQYYIGNITIDSNSVKQSTIERVLRLRQGQLYRNVLVSESYNALQGLHNFKYTNIDLHESPLNSDTTHLVDAHIRLLNSTRRKISASLELSNASPFGTQQSGNFLTNGNFGIETILGYQNRNLFGGAEQLKVEGSLLLELPKLMLSNGNAAFHDTFTAFEGGLNASIDIPRFLLPFATHLLRQHNRPHTLVSLGGNYQYRTYFERVLFNTSFGYMWSHHRYTQHQLRPIELTYVNFLNLDPNFLGRLQGTNDLRIKYQYSDHFVMDARYNYVYNNQTYGSRTNFSFLNASIETAGNLLNGLSAAFNGAADSSGVYQFLGVPYSQYVKLNIDAKRYHYHWQKCTFVSRLLMGVGIPYGNSLSLPYEKSFFGGGPTTMRAWQLRHLGPGSYSRTTNDLLERVGDISFVFNLEERFPLISVLEGALFADIGNVWLVHPSEVYSNGNIQANRLLHDLAVGVGVGLRCNISILTIRADFALPLCDPGYDNPWRLPYWNIKQVVTNFGIGYPF